MKLGHIINPVKVGPGSDLRIAQPVTFETMRRAQAFVRGQVEVDLFTTQYPEDHEILPDGFTILPDLDRSVLDVNPSFETKRKLPLLADILQRLYDGTDADYLIYTNVDIGLMPSFYLSVAALLAQHDGLIINRRTITDQYTAISEIPLMYAEIGEKHFGYDCFIFARDKFPRMHFEAACIGAKVIGQIMYANIVANSTNVLEVKDAHLTFHLGNDRVWTQDKFKPYTGHNGKQGQQAILRLREDTGPLNNSTPLGRYLIEKFQSQGSSWLKPILEQDNPPQELRPPLGVRISRLQDQCKDLIRNLLARAKTRSQKSE